MHIEAIWIAMGILLLSVAVTLVYFLIKYSKNTKCDQNSNECVATTKRYSGICCDDLFSETRYNIIANESRKARKNNKPFIKGVDTIDTVKAGTATLNRNEQSFIDVGGEYNNEFSDC